MAEDVTLSVGADTGKAKADIESLRKVFGEFFQSFGLGKDQAKAFSEAYATELFKIGASTDEAKAKIAELRPELEKLAEEARNAGGGTGEFNFNLKDLAKSAGAGISILSVLRENLQDLAPILERNVDLLKDLAVGAGADATTLDGLSLALDTLLHPTHAIANANKAAAEASKIIQDAYVGETTVVVNLTEAQRKLAAAKGLALRAGQEREDSIRKEREENAALAEVLANTATEELKNGEASKRTREEIEKLNQAYADTGDAVPPKLAAIVKQLGILTNEQEKAAKDSERLAERAEKDAERRAKAEEKAAERIAKSLEANAERINEQIKVYEDAVKRLDEANAKLEEAQRTDIFGRPVNAANKSVDELEKKIVDLRSQPIIDYAELAKAEDALKDLRLKARKPFPGQDSGPDPNAKLIEEQQEAQALHDKEAEKLDKLYDKRAKLTGATKEGAGAQASLNQAIGEGGAAADVTVAAFDDYLASMAETDRLTREAAGSTADLGEEAAGAAVRIETLADGTRKITNVVDAAGKGFEKVGSILTETFADGRKVMLNLGEETQAVADKAESAAEGVGALGKAVAEVGKGEGSAAPLAGLAASLEGAKTGIAEVDAAIVTLTANLRIVDELVGQIATKLAGLGLAEGDGPAQQVLGKVGT